MPFSNSIFTFLTKALNFTPFVQSNTLEGGEPPPPPVPCLLVDQEGDFIVLQSSGDNVLVHCTQQFENVITINNQRVTTIYNDEVVAIAPE